MAWSTIYVSKTGSDASSNPSNIGTPYATIKKALENLNSGGTVYVRGGTYYTGVLANPFLGTATWGNLPSGSSGNPTIIRPYEEEPAILSVNNNAHTQTLEIWNKTFVTFQGLIFSGNDITNHVFRTFNCNDIEIVECEIRDSSILFLKSGFGHRVNIRRCTLHNTITTYNNPQASNAIYYGSGGDSSDCIVEDNLIYDIGRTAIQIQPTGNPTNPNQFDRFIVRRNRIYNFNRNTGGATQIYITAGYQSQVYYNLVYGQNSGADTFFGMIDIAIKVDDATGTRRGDVSVFNNIVHGSKGYGISFRGGTGHLCKNNIALENALGNFYDPGGLATSSNNVFTGTPSDLWENPINYPTNSSPETRDYTPKATASAILNQGVAVGIAFDLFGTIVPQGVAPDIGAVERIQSGLWAASLQIPSGTWLNSSISGHTCRFLMLASAWGTSVTSGFRLIFRGRTDANYTIQKVSIVERDGATLNGIDGTNQQATFGGTWATGGTVPQDGELASDVISYALDESKDYFVTFYASGWVGQYFDNTGGADNAWFISGDDATDIDWGAKSPTITWPHVYSVTRIEELGVADPSAPGLNVGLTQIVTPGILHSLNADASDADGNIVTGYVLCAAGNAGFDFDPSGCTITHKTS